MTDKASQYTTTPLTRWSVQTSLSVFIFYVKLKVAFGPAIKQFYSEWDEHYLSLCKKYFNRCVDGLGKSCTSELYHCVTVYVSVYHCVTVYVSVYITVSLYM